MQTGPTDWPARTDLGSGRMKPTPALQWYFWRAPPHVYAYAVEALWQLVAGPTRYPTTRAWLPCQCIHRDA